MIGSSRSYAIGWAHFQRAGGWKSVAIMLGVYLFVVFAALILFYYIDSTAVGPHKGLTNVAITVLLAAQTVVLGIFGSARVSSAVRHDLTSRMIESHRLMPVSNSNAIFGYIFGPTTHTLAFFALNTLFAYIFAFITSTNIWQVTLGQAVLLVFCIFIWSAAVVSTFIARYIMFIAIGLAIFGGCTMGIWVVFYFLPGCNILLAPFMGSTIYTFSSSTVTLTWPYFASFAAQGAFFVVFFNGACRRYRGLSPTTLSLPAAVLFVGAWSGASIAGLLNKVGGTPFGIHNEDLHQGQILASIIVAMGLALIPLRTAVTLEKPSGRMNLLWSFLTGLLLVACVSMICVGGIEGTRPLYSSIAITVVVTVAHVIAVYALFRLLRRMRSWLAIVFAVVICGFLWASPLIVEALLALANPNPNPYSVDIHPDIGTFGGFSAMGSLLNAWVVKTPGPVIPGLIAQNVFAAMLLVIALVMSRLSKKPAVAAPAVLTAAPPSPAST